MTEKLNDILSDFGEKIASLLSDQEIKYIFFQVNPEYIGWVMKMKILENLPCDSDSVKEISLWDMDPKIRKEAILRINDQEFLKEKAITDLDINCKLAAVNKIDSEKLLKEVFEFDDLPDIVAEKVIDKIDM